MLFLAAGIGVVALFMLVARAFSRARIATVKSLAAWVAALAGLSLAGMLLLTGRSSAAIGGAVLVGPLLWDWWKRFAAGRPARPAAARPRAAAMTRAEALDVLGLRDPVSDEEIRAAWLRLMRVAHPDGGGSDWLAVRINQAKDVLLGRG